MNSWKEHKSAWISVNFIEMLDEIMKQSVVQNEIIRLNHEQLESGIDANDKTIKTIGGSPYRPFTVVRKKLKNQPTNRVTLKDTGAFYNTFRVRTTKEGYKVLADFEKKTGSILDNFASDFDFLGLTPESLAELVYETILPRLERMIIQKLNA
jgi:hypothetical protein